eukprot:232331-Amphidinium_carterae.1
MGCKVRGATSQLILSHEASEWSQDKPLKPRKDMASTFWNCGTCGFYNFGYRTECFACKCARGNAKIQKTGGPASKPGSPIESQDPRPHRQDNRLQGADPMVPPHRTAF